MYKSKLTVKGINSLQPREKVYEIRDGNGFGLRVYPSGNKRLFFSYIINGRRKQISIGNYPSLSLKDARSISEKLRNQVAKGLDPLAIKREEKKRKVYTFENLGKEFLEKHCKQKRKSWKEDERILNTYILTSNLIKLNAKDIKRRDIKKLTDDIANNRGKVMANRVFSFIRTMFNYGMAAEIIEFSPCIGLSKPGGEEIKKSRYLKDEEITDFWKGLDESLINPAVIKALKIILLTGQRPSEVCGMHSDEINGHWWTIPGQRTKNGRDHSVYLTDLALEIIGDRKGAKFISATTNKTITRHQLSQAIHRKFAPLPKDVDKIKHIPTNPESRTRPRRWNFEKFTPHDLRRTCATHLVDLGFPQLLVGHILNHTDQSVTAIYNQYSYDKEKQQAMEIWTEKIIKIVGLDKK